MSGEGYDLSVVEKTADRTLTEPDLFPPAAVRPARRESVMVLLVGIIVLVGVTAIGWVGSSSCIRRSSTTGRGVQPGPPTVYALPVLLLLLLVVVVVVLLFRLVVVLV